jgi:pimeloyl-ACP methyl ester carboxylesterase
MVRFIETGDLRLAYRELGDGPPVLLVHGWPTSSHLWRGVMPAIAEAGSRAIALDLPGYGASSKLPGVTYDFAFYDAALDGFTEALGIEATALAVHDIGGPVALHWALNRPRRLTKLALLNTLVYPEFSDMVQQFLHACSTSPIREQLTSPQGLEAAMKLGLADESRLTPEVLAAVVEPFGTDAERRSLADAGIGLTVEGFEEIARLLPDLEVPVRVIYGEQDRILPDVAETMERVKRDCPQAEVTALPDCGHFLQEEAPDEIGRLLAEFFAA